MFTMILRGKWRNRNTKEIMDVYGPLGSDNYNIDYSLDGITSEELDVLVYYGEEKREAVIRNSKKFGDTHMLIHNPDLIQINQEEYERVTPSKLNQS